MSLENEPMGTAGPIRLAEDKLRENNESGLFFVFNSDVICEYPLQELVAYHKSHGKQGTIVVTKVEDPTRYGVVIAQENGQIERFVEKPTTFVSNKINAGLYLFSLDMIDRIENRPTSIEREIFPVMAGEAQLHQMELPGYWMDIGQPGDYILGQSMYIKSQVEMGSNSAALVAGHGGSSIIIHETAEVDPSAQLGPNVVVGAGCKIGPGVRIRNATILDETKVNGFSFISDCIIGRQNTIGSWVRMTEVSCTGDDVQVKDETSLTAVKILPHKAVTGVHAKTIIM